MIETYNLDILCFKETWESNSEKVNLSNWQVLSKPQKQNAHGGVAVLNKQTDKFIILRKPELEKDEVEAICATVKSEKQEEFLLITAYVPPEKIDHGDKLFDRNCKFNALSSTGILF